jgi:tRNA-dihydrouridine synthase B
MLPLFSVGTVPVYGDLILAPMDGYSDWPFRSLCRELGSAMSYTEFINAMDIIHGHPHVQAKLSYQPAERPVVFQLFDNDPDRLLQAARLLQERQPDIIDINLGCSARCVSYRGAGAGLLRTPAKITEIFQKLTQALSVPVTAKIRLGWDDTSRNYLEVARMLEDNGAALIAVHGRTKMQGYGGQADWDAIAEVRQAVSIPVIGNGDVRSVADIQRLKAHTGCSAVMIGRGAIGNPWIFSRLDRETVPPEVVRATLHHHFERMQAFHGPKWGLILFRKHAERYLGIRKTTLSRPISEALRHQMLTTLDTAEFLALADSVIISDT